ncbi:hypothetical protein [Streptomyces sp. NBC_01006]|uniref:hypothetical protein n=1 Tax=Streptomyces sp. NBC_01006 TaxID=2903716 RepID=UPI002F9170D3|nr:hypothetical protein OG509_42380 [Streptomyces sp. NBC_01006]
MPNTIPLKRPLDATGLPPRQSPEPEPSAPAAVPEGDATAYHHPAFVRVEPGHFAGDFIYYFTGFTGREPQPEVPLAAYDDQTLDYDQIRELSRQYRSAQVLWSQARLRLLAVPVLQQAVPLWDAWTAARDELRLVFSEFWTTADGKWKAQLLRLTDAESVAKKAARKWDDIAEQLAKLAADQVHVAGYDHELDLSDVAQAAGLDIRGWNICHADEYKPPYNRPTPLVYDLDTEIKEQRERLTEVAALAGDITASA